MDGDTLSYLGLLLERIAIGSFWVAVIAAVVGFFVVRAMNKNPDWWK